MDVPPEAFRAPPTSCRGAVRPDTSTDSATATPPEDAFPARVALCLHRAVAGTGVGPSSSDLPHVDLFIAPFDAANPPDDDARIVRSWRLPVAACDWRTTIASTPTAAIYWSATPTPAHRALYLRLAQPRTLDDGRGLVEPLAAGNGWMISRPDELVAEVRLAPADGAGAATAVRIEVREDATGSIAKFHLLETCERAKHDG
ncbi:MAG: hypothetical protein ACKO3W_03515 [bacterium]